MVPAESTATPVCGSGDGNRPPIVSTPFDAIRTLVQVSPSLWLMASHGCPQYPFGTYNVPSPPTVIEPAPPSHAPGIPSSPGPARGSLTNAGRPAGRKVRPPSRDLSHVRMVEVGSAAPP